MDRGGLVDWDNVEEIAARLRLLTECKEYRDYASLKGRLLKINYETRKQGQRLEALEARMFRLQNALRRIANDVVALDVSASSTSSHSSSSSKEHRSGSTSASTADTRHGWSFESSQKEKRSASSEKKERKEENNQRPCEWPCEWHDCSPCTKIGYHTIHECDLWRGHRF